MSGILRRNMIYYLIYGGFFLVFQAAMWAVSIERLSPALAMISSFYLFFMAVVPAVSAEALDDKFNGYAFLSTLPLRLETVMRAKFALPLIALGAGVAFSLVMFETIGGMPPVIRDCRNILFFNAAVVIVLVGISFLILFRYGARNYLTALVFVGVGFNLLGLVAFRFGLGDWVLGGVPRLVTGRSTWWFVVMLHAGFIVYWRLMKAAVRIKRDRLFA